MRTGSKAPPSRDGDAATPVERAAHPGVSNYTRWLAWAFAIFNSVRTVSYLPTLWAIHASGESDQHALLTWFTWTGANATMAAWLYEQTGRRMNRAIAVTVCNAVMCLLTSVTIVWYRLLPAA